MAFERDAPGVQGPYTKRSPGRKLRLGFLQLSESDGEMLAKGRRTEEMRAPCGHQRRRRHAETPAWGVMEPWTAVGGQHPR